MSIHYVNVPFDSGLVEVPRLFDETDILGAHSAGWLPMPALGTMAQERIAVELISVLRTWLKNPRSGARHSIPRALYVPAAVLPPVL
ncbi:MAG: hypothetical protein JWP19_2163 [Rhodoglobus sp.]|nr:hypothetical protein [Rhodoglobus sp.]